MMGKQYSPLFIVLLIIGSAILIQIHFKLLDFGNLLLAIILISIAVPGLTYLLRNKDSGYYPRYGCLTGFIIGFLVISKMFSFITNDINPYDLFFVGLLGASILSTLGVVAGDLIGRHKRKK